MPGYLKRMYPPKPVPVHHTNGEVHSALVDEVNITKKDARAMDVRMNQEHLFKEREPVVHAGTKEHKAYKRVQNKAFLSY
jgi:hypothetical protein